MEDPLTPMFAVPLFQTQYLFFRSLSLTYIMFHFALFSRHCRDAAKTSTLAPENPHLQSVSRQLRDVERERDTAQDELRRLKVG